MLARLKNRTGCYNRQALPLKRINRVIYQEVVPPSVLAFMVLTFIVFSRQFGRLTELLIKKNADGVTVLKVVVFLLPSILVFTVPIAFLVGTLIGFSRLSSESEIVAMRAGGIGLMQILSPVLKLGTGVSLLTLVLTLFLLPQGAWNLKLVREEIGVRPVRSQIKPRVFNEDFPGILLYVHDVEVGSDVWKGVLLAQAPEAGRHQVVLSRTGQIVIGPDGRRLQVFLEDGANYDFNENDPGKYSVSRFGSLGVSVELPEAEPVARQPKKPIEKSVRELLRDASQAPGDVEFQSRVEIHRRIALAFAPLVFAVLGVTLGIRAHRGGRGYGSIVSLVVAFTFYMLFATGSRMASQGAIHWIAGIWGANLLLGVAALASLRFASLASGDGSFFWRRSRSGRLLSALAGALGRAARRLHLVRRELERRRRPRVRMGLARVIDLYLIKTFLMYALPTLLVCLGLFYLFTFFELIDDLVKNDQPYSLMAEYFVYLLPHALMLLIPISMLIATLTTFGLMEKTAQLIAFKASGISLYRLVVPVVMVALVASVATFLLQEYVLPYANQRQDSLRNVIQGRPIQTFYHPGRNWIFGDDYRLYNYNYFDPDRNLFAEISIYEMDISGSRLNRHIYAFRALWDRERQGWNLLQGWVRDLTPGNEGFTSFEENLLVLPEKPDYFVREVKESTKMTYLELSQYLNTLQEAGLEVDHLRTDLHTKIAFPFVSLVMAILGVPFALSVGRKGALYGVAAAVFLGIFYWGAFGVFGVLGTNGLLAPLLAAWGPNLVFLSSSLALLLSART